MDSLYDKDVIPPFVFKIVHRTLFSFLRVGSWSPGSKKDLQSLLYPPPERYYQNLHGKLLKISLFRNWPYFEYQKAADGSLQPISGIDHSIVQVLASKLNFTYVRDQLLTVIVSSYSARMLAELYVRDQLSIIGSS